MKVVFCCILFGVWAFYPLEAQKKLSTKNKKTVRLYHEARDFFAEGNLSQARISLEQALDREPRFIEAMLLLGDLHHSQKDYEAERSILQKALSVDSAFYVRSYLNLGVAAFYTERYKEALDYLEAFKRKSTDSLALKRADSWIRRVEWAQKAWAKPWNIVLRNEGPGINSAYDEYWPCLTADEQTMVVTVLVPRDDNLFREKGGHLPHSSAFFREDFYRSMAANDSLWLPRHPIPGHINTQNNEGAQSLSADGNWMFFTACGRPDSRGSCDIYFSQKTAQGWSKPVNIGAPVNTPFWESQPCFAADGRTLLFISNRGGGVGGKDIWQVTMEGVRADGTPYFGRLVNLGPGINTSKDENSPFLHHDGRTLYFSSDGHVGMGKMDLFISRKSLKGQWTSPVNLGVPINTVDDEIGLVVNAKGNRAYFASDGQTAEATGKDIYSFALPVPLRPNPALYVKGKVFDVKSGRALAARFKLTDLNTGELAVTARGNETTGEFLVSLPTGGHYAFEAEYPGYLFYSGNFDLSSPKVGDAPFQLNIGLQPITSGARIRLENIFFYTDSFRLAPESKVELGELARFLRNNPDVHILLEGHTDNVGSEEYNLNLSRNRAQAAYLYLIDQGIKAERLDFKGFGFSKPLESNDTPEGRARNRRTEILIL